MRHDSLVMFDALALIADGRGNPMEVAEGYRSNLRVVFQIQRFGGLRSHLCRTGSGRTPTLC